MARLRAMHTMLLSRDSTETLQAFERKQAADELVDAFANSNARTVDVLPTVSLGVNFDGLTNVQFIYVESDKEVRLTINGSATPIRVLPRVSAANAAVSLSGRFMVWTEAVTSLVVVNPSSTDTAKVTVALAGA